VLSPARWSCIQIQSVLVEPLLVVAVEYLGLTLVGEDERISWILVPDYVSVVVGHEGYGLEGVAANYGLAVSEGIDEGRDVVVIEGLVHL